MSKTAWTAVIGIGLLVVVMLGASLVGPSAWGAGMMGPGMMGGFGFPFFGGMMLLFWVLVIGGLVWFVQALAHGGGMAGMNAPPEAPLDILKRRYARGEITKEQFEAMKRDLNA